MMNSESYQAVWLAAMMNGAGGMFSAEGLKNMIAESSLALRTRKGTGFYRVPSLRMIWLDNCFLHDGALGSLDEMFDPKRLDTGFRPSNWPASAPPRPVRGHPFGLNLSTQDRSALVAFLKTL